MQEAADKVQTHEARVFTQWILSLNIPQLFIHNILQDVRDGIVLLKVLDHLEPGIVNWKKTNKPKAPGESLNRYKRVENCNIIVTGKQIGRAHV